MTDNQSLNTRRQAATPRGVATATQIFAQKGENAELWDVEGRRYVDFAGGIAVLNTGHCNPAVLARAAEQMARFTHTAYQVVPYEPYVELAEKLNALAPGKSAKKSFFVTTGAEAVENAVKIARAYTGRPGVIAFSGGFHGRTNLTMGLTGKVAPYKKGFGPFPGEVYHLPFPMPMHGVTVEDTVAALEQLFRADSEPERIAAIIIEPVQGEGGFYIAPTELLQHLRQVCDRHGIVLIADEIQSGFPLAGVVGKAEIMDAPEPGGLGGTYGGNPVSCAAALGVLDEIERLGLNRRAEALGNRVVDRIRAVAAREDTLPIGDVRQLGAMIAFELVERRGTNKPNAAAAKALCAQALENGLILLSCGVFGNSIRILVPLTASDAIVDEGMTILEQSLRQVAALPAAAE